ncbi:hypothetical protein ACHHYP_20106 [Achlya hypogyna]|uniref:Uncharacterized protein n=1 Tax=Achlya hypogyna TaxID=1202772 RepID=A0A1V9Z5X7_ACHHY|nr:hypothetical protein ACHHYP_20106 [Achlya hypogyna]
MANPGGSPPPATEEDGRHAWPPTPVSTDVNVAPVKTASWSPRPTKNQSATAAPKLSGWPAGAPIKDGPTMNEPEPGELPAYQWTGRKP